MDLVHKLWSYLRSVGPGRSLWTKIDGLWSSLWSVCGLRRWHLHFWKILILVYLGYGLLHFVGAISMVMQQPSKVHFGAAKRIVCYIIECMDYGIWHSQVFNFIICELTDSYYVGSLDDRRSIWAHICTLSSGVINCYWNKPARTTLSMFEAAYIAATSFACQAIWLIRMLA